MGSETLKGPVLQELLRVCFRRSPNPLPQVRVQRMNLMMTASKVARTVRS